ncbi:MAG: SURF1 family protein [Hoeflea sp.]|uniref:SURF1 family protein n=1 Tax=Hoeflea sp. TaxID=1940281 RepID=UPI0032EB4012
MIDAHAPARSLRLRFWALAILFPSAFAVLIALGTWQVQRLAWKLDLLASIEQRSRMEPAGIMAIEQALEEGVPVEYRTATVTGEYIHGGEQHFFATFNGQTGYYVYTPLELAGGRYLLVNRGFVPYDLKEASTRPGSLTPGIQTVTGLVREKLSEKPSFIVPDNDEAENIYYWKDLDRMAANAGLPADEVLQFFLDADATPVPGGLPRGGVTVIDLPNNHLQYAITWYGLAAALAGVGLFAWFRRKS